jgi:YegS/Rv2252/BmrU family lipid kinase
LPKLASIIQNRGGGSATDQRLALARAVLDAHYTVEVVDLEQGQSPAELARQCLARGSELLIASGGDGTVAAVASALIGHPRTALGILPGGTANSIAASLGIPENPEAAAALLCEPTLRLIDTALVNERPMVLLATLGVHAEAVTEADPEQKRRLGPLAYVLEAASRLLEDSLFEVTLEVGEARVTRKVSAATVANLAPAKTLLAQGPERVIGDDGLLDVTLVAIDGLGEAVATSLHLAARAVAEQPADRDNIAFFRTQSIRISAPEGKRWMVDGEDAGAGPVRIRSVPRSLRVVVPGDAR